ncbi:MAG TPA: (2Fe-2S) ferredoxin domain-containing protein [Pirellulales bacterium]|nr:(2Fe-2S) ferredoxin domain-containing protein [Pirellulales bacterium]
MDEDSLVCDQRSSRTQSQLGQLLLCRGCCCGQTARGLPAVPVERIKAVWKAEKLNRTIQLTISGCLGPCDVPNVVLILTPKESRWYADLSGDAIYDELVEWARACHSASSLLPLPAALETNRLERFS